MDAFKKPTKKLVKVAVASTLGVMLLIGGSTYALWSSTAIANNGAVISTGDLQVTAASPQKWFDVTTETPKEIPTLADYRLAPGNTIQLEQEITAVVVGDNLEGTLSVKIPNDTQSAPIFEQALFSLEIFDKEGRRLLPMITGLEDLTQTIPYLPVTDADGDIYTVRVTVELPNTADNTTKLQTIALNNMAITLSQKEPAEAEAPVDNSDPTAASNFSWEVYEDTATITEYTGTSKNVVIPSTYESNGAQKRVIGVANNAFANKGLTSVVIPDSINSIAPGAFANNQLTSVVIPDSVGDIGLSAFEDNEISSLVIGNSVNAIDTLAFKNNRLTSVTIPSSMYFIGASAFDANPLTSIYMEGNTPFAGVADKIFGEPTVEKTVYHKVANTTYPNPWLGYATATY